MGEEYAYGVARAHVREGELLTKTDINRLVSANTYNDAVQFLRNKGYSSGDSIDEILSAKKNYAWDFISEIGVDEQYIRLFRYDADFHNIKAAIKAHITSASVDGLLVDYGNIDSDEIWEIIQKAEYDKLPNKMKEAAQNAVDVLLKTRDGQLSDMIIDKAGLEYLLDMAKETKNKFVIDYFSMFISLKNILIAARCSAFKKTEEFIFRALADDTIIDKKKLSKNAAKGKEELCKYLMHTPFEESVKYLEKSMTDFEKWCDEKLLDIVKEERKNIFGIGPIISYILSVENELKIVRFILTCKLNNLNEELVKERVGGIYG